MTEKVKLPKDIYKALNIAREFLNNAEIVSYTNLKYWNELETKVLNKATADTIMQALVLGYEAELSAEEQLKNLYMKYETETLYCNGVQNGILVTLEILGIHYDWMDDAE